MTRPHDSSEAGTTITHRRFGPPHSLPVVARFTQARPEPRPPGPRRCRSTPILPTTHPRVVNSFLIGRVRRARPCCAAVSGRLQRGIRRADDKRFYRPATDDKRLKRQPAADDKRLYRLSRPVDKRVSPVGRRYQTGSWRLKGSPAPAKLTFTAPDARPPWTVKPHAHRGCTLHAVAGRCCHGR